MEQQDFYECFVVENPEQAAKDAVESLRHHIEQAPRWMESPPDPSECCERRVIHQFSVGTHVDPDLGRWYVPAKKELSQREKTLIGKRNQKVAKLDNDVCDQIRGGADPLVLQASLREQQTHPCVVLTIGYQELEAFLIEAFTNGDLLPGCIEGGYVAITPRGDWHCIWGEGLACEGGETDRYGSIAL